MRTPHLFMAMAMAAVLSACGTNRFNLPPIAEGGDGTRLPGKIIWHDLLSDTPEQSRKFYSGLFGWEFEPLSGGINYTLIRHRGKLIGGMVDQNRLPNKVDISQWVVAMSVADIEQAAAGLRAAGGTVFTPPTSLGDRGRIAVVADPQGALLALLQTADGDPVDDGTIPASGDFLWHELWTAEAAKSSRFYQDLVRLTEEKTTLDSASGPLEYRILSGRGQARVGVRPPPAEDIPAMWVSYLRMAGTAELAAVLARVEALGGRVLVPATMRPDGGSLAIIEGPSGAGIALQTWPDNQQLGRREEGQ